MGTEKKNKVVILYDGECALCNWGVQFLIKRDKHKKFVYLSQNSPTAEDILNKYNPPSPETVLLLYKNKIYIKSDAVFVALSQLGKGWQFFTFLKIVPKAMRDSVYDYIARNRKKWFGTTNYCRLPDKVSNF